VSLLAQAADILETHDHRKGAFAQGLLVDHRPKGDKPWPKPKEIYPWNLMFERGDDLEAKENQGKIYKLTALSALGAICFVAQATPDDADVQAAITRCNAVLQTRGIEWTLETWNDAPQTTKEEVVALLREA